MQVRLLDSGGCKNAQWLWVYASRQEIDKKKKLLLEKTIYRCLSRTYMIIKEQNNTNLKMTSE